MTYRLDVANLLIRFKTRLRLALPENRAGF